MSAIEALLAVGQREKDADELHLPPWDVAKVTQAAGKFKAGTGLGVDRLRPRHIIMLSREAKGSLARIFEAIEAFTRWPELLREILEVAIGKKTWGLEAHRPGCSPLQGVGEGQVRRLSGSTGGQN